MKRIYKKVSSIISHSSSGKGFTLIELLIVIAILGILAAVIIVAINPLEQLARARDSGREGDVTQLGHAMQAYYTNQARNTYPAASNNWQSKYLVTGQEINNVIAVSATNGTGTPPLTPCGTTSAGNNMDVEGTLTTYICYGTNVDLTDAMIWTTAESHSADVKAGGGTKACTSYGAAGSYIPVFAWIASQGKAGVACLSTTYAFPAAGGGNIIPGTTPGTDPLGPLY